VPTRPAAPVAPPLVEEDVPEDEAATDEVSDESAYEPGEIYDDGDAVIVPAPSAEVFLAKPRPTPKPKSSYAQSIQFKQTVIPVLLTLGVIGILSAAMPFLSPSASGIAVLRGQPLLLTLLASVGLAFLVVAWLNMLQVKSTLDAQKTRK
jgi:hypothetical protein